MPEFGTDYVMWMIAETRPQCLSDLVRIAGLAHGTDVWYGNAQELVANGIADLRSIICSRDDIMLYLMKQGIEREAAYHIMERARKGKGLLPADEAKMRAASVPEWYMDSCNKIKYLFPKAHAAAYTIMAWRIAWYKVYHPGAFYEAYLSVKCDGQVCEAVYEGKERVAQEIRIIEDKFGQRNSSQEDMDRYTELIIAQEVYARGIKIEKARLHKAQNMI